MTLFDSNVWIAFFDEDDSQHAKAERTVLECDGPVAISEYVVGEVCTVLKQKAGGGFANQFIHHIFDNSEIVVKASSPNLFLETVRMFKDEKYKQLSFVDTSLLYLSKSYNIVTFDKKLAQAIAKR